MSCQQKFSTWLLSQGTLAMKYSTELPHKRIGYVVTYFIHLSFFMGHPRQKFAQPLSSLSASYKLNTTYREGNR